MGLKPVPSFEVEIHHHCVERGTAVNFSALCKQPSVWVLPEVAAIQDGCVAVAFEWLESCNVCVNSWEITAAAARALQWNNLRWGKFAWEKKKKSRADCVMKRQDW